MMRALAHFAARRIAALICLMALISFAIFSLLYVAPGDVAQSLLGTQGQSPQAVAALRARYHLDEPFLTQYWLWLKGVVLHFDFGRSATTGLPVTTTIRLHYGVTIFLGVYAFLMMTVAGVFLGITAAVRNRSLLDRGIVGMSVLGASMPAFVSSILLLYLLAVRLSWFPIYGPGSGFTGRLYHLTLPAIALALVLTAVVVKLTRAAMVDVLSQDYVAFARARGVPPHRVLVTYALRNALIPVLTASTLIFAGLLTGAVFVEYVFALPGLGSLLLDAIQQKDIPMVQGLSLLVAATMLMATLLTDLFYVLVDPRIRMEGMRA